MKQLVYKEPYTNKEPLTMSVQAAIGHYIDRRAYADGQIEQIGEQVSSNEKMLGKLVQALADKGLLQADDLLKMLDEHYTLVDQ